jgi:hypothetical protein
MDCGRCQYLESIRYDRIRKYCDLFEERKTLPAEAAGLTQKIEAVERELNQAWRELDLHRRSHQAVTACA